MPRLYAAGPNAVAIVEGGSVRTALEGRGAQSLAVGPKDPDTLYVGTSEEGLFKSTDGGESWEKLPGIEYPRVTAIALSPADGALYAGTEPSSLFISRDGGASWRELKGLKNMPSAPTWSFPPRPWTSHVRAIAPSHTDPNLVVVGIELGGGKEHGRRADLAAPAPRRPSGLPLPGRPPRGPRAPVRGRGRGFAQSRDFGDSWEAADEGMDLRYAWGFAADVEDPSLVYASAAS